MCNCADHGTNYAAYKNAAAACNAYPAGSAGYGSCVTNAFGFVSIHFWFAFQKTLRWFKLFNLFFQFLVERWWPICRCRCPFGRSWRWSWMRREINQRRFLFRWCLGLAWSFQLQWIGWSFEQLLLLCWSCRHCCNFDEKGHYTFFLICFFFFLGMWKLFERKLECMLCLRM